ncbi:uncharacterized protein LOC117080967 [Trachypithecus francoisi]|uniref:uncharacterized protein LOC117080967 n=1 Tax=Trachypithecus francoisi TaxID=54180 RepID=UPI00141A9C77|nr:uncharacterized protein LOC117080967 [Trachypithecus francoisi]
MVHTQVQGTPWQSVGHPLPGKDTSCIKETCVFGVRRLKAGPRGEPSHGRRRNLKVWVQSLRSCAGSTWGHSRWTGSSRVCSNWTGSRMTHSLRSSSRAYSNCTRSNHKSHSPPWSPHRSHSWGRNRLAHSSTWACSSRRAHSSQSQSPHSWSHSLQSSHSSPWFRTGSMLQISDVRRCETPSQPPEQCRCLPDSCWCPQGCGIFFVTTVAEDGRVLSIGEGIHPLFTSSLFLDQSLWAGQWAL